MEGKFRIYVEGKEDKLFLESYINHLLGNRPSQESFTELKGKDNLARPNIEKALARGEKAVLIFDANSDYKGTRARIQSRLNGLSFKLFLFPDNRSNGVLEDLLEQTVILKHRNIFKCFEDYKKCLEREDSRYILPGLKGKIYSYKEAIGALGGTRENQFSPEYWDFDNAALQPLKDFLLANLQ